MRPLALSPRLLACANYLRRGEILADIGTDHAHLPIFAVQAGICPRAFASDLREGPLRRARENVAAHGLEGSIALTLCDGIAPEVKSAAGDLVIAGMGGEAIAAILARAMPFRPEQQLILQPQTKAERLRAFLGESGFAIAEEAACEGAGKVYAVMSAYFTGKRAALDPVFCAVGRIRADAPAGRMYIEKVLARARKKLGGLRLGAAPRGEIDAAEALVQGIEMRLSSGAAQ